MKPSGSVPMGRPAIDEERPSLRPLTFLIDPETLEALALLKGELGGEPGSQSIAIRRAIQRDAERLTKRTI